MSTITFARDLNIRDSVEIPSRWLQGRIVAGRTIYEAIQDWIDQENMARKAGLE